MVINRLTRVNGRKLFAGMKKTGFAKRSRFSSNPIWQGLLAILLDARGAQAGQTMLVDRELPGQEFVHGQRVAAAGFLEGEQAASDRRDDFGLAANNPPLGAGRGKIRNGQR